MNATVSQLVSEYASSNASNPASWIEYRIAGAFVDLDEITVSDEDKQAFLVEVDELFPLS